MFKILTKQNAKKCLHKDLHEEESRSVFKTFIDDWNICNFSYLGWKNKQFHLNSKVIKNTIESMY